MRMFGLVESKKKIAVAVFSFCQLLAASAAVTAHYTFDDVGNDGLNLLKADVGSDAFVRKNPAVDEEGLGGLYAVSGENRTDGVGAIAIPKGEFLAIPHGLAKQKESRWFMKMRIFMPTVGNNTWLQLDQDNGVDSFVFIKSPSRLGGNTSWGGYTTYEGLFGAWHTVILSCNGSVTAIYIDGKVVVTSNTWGYFSGGSDLSAADYFYVSADNDGEDGLLYVEDLTIGSGTYEDNIVIVPDAGHAVYNGQARTSSLVDTDDYSVVKNEGGVGYGLYPVVLSLKNPQDKPWEDGTTEDKTIWFAIRDPLYPELTAHFSFDDAGNDGLNLLKATVGASDIAVRGGSPAVDREGLGSLYAVNGEGHEDGTGAIAVPLGDFMLVPHGVDSSVQNTPWRLDLKYFQPESAGMCALLSLDKDNKSDAHTFINKGISIGCGKTWGGYAYGCTEMQKWRTVSIVNDGLNISLWVNGTWIKDGDLAAAATTRGVDLAGKQAFNISGDNSDEDGLLFFDDIKVYGPRADVRITPPADVGPVLAATGEALEPQFGNTRDYAIRGKVKAVAPGEYSVPVGLLDPKHASWADGTTADRLYTFVVATNANAWVQEPAIAATSWAADGVAPAFNQGTSAYGEVSVTLDGAPFDGSLPLTEGQHVIRVFVPGNLCYSGLEKTLTVMVLPAGGVIPPEITSACYVKDGLVMHLDAIDNAEVGRHDGAATVWKDLSGNAYDWTINSSYAKWMDDGIAVSGKGVIPADLQSMSFASRVNVIECVWTMAENVHGIIFGPGFADSAYIYSDTDGHVGFWGVNALRIGTPSEIGVAASYSAAYVRDEDAVKPTALKDFLVNGTSAEQTSMGDYWGYKMTDGPSIGYRGVESSIVAKGTVHALRVYDRDLSDGERRLNAAVDHLRFGTGGGLPEGELPDGYRVANGELQVSISVSARRGGTVSVNGNASVPRQTVWASIGTSVTVDALYTSPGTDRADGFVRTGFPSDAVVSTDGRKVTFTATAPVSAVILHENAPVPGMLLFVR